MKQSSRVLVLCLALLPLAAFGDTFKCVSPNGKIKYTNQVSNERVVTCDQMFVKKPPISQVDPAAGTKPEAKAPAAPAQEGGEAVPAADKPVAAKEAPAAPPKTQADKDLEAKRKKAEADEAKKKADKSAQDKQAEQKTKDQNCQNAKSNLATYKMGRVRRVDDKGEYYYLDDAAVKDGLAQAEKDVAENCK